MQFIRSRYLSTCAILEAYKYPEPFKLHLKKFFKEQKKYGSKDRRVITDLCYFTLRTALLSERLDLKSTVLLGIALFSDIESSSWQILVKEVEAPLLPDTFFGSERSVRLKLASKVWPLNNANIHYRSSMLCKPFRTLNSSTNLGYQPNVWLHVSKQQSPPEHAEQSSELNGAYSVEHSMTLAEEYQIQDLSSQKLCSEIQLNNGDKVWDCCSGAGGKSLYISDAVEALFYLSDNRPNILRNARNRFKNKENTHYTLHDLLDQKKPLQFSGEVIPQEFFDCIVADVPCSGSGTWFRNPEHFKNFNYDSLPEYNKLQTSIVSNSISYLKRGGLFYYLTCSVFKLENDDVVEYCSGLGLELQRTIYFQGQTHGADSMFFAEFRKT